MSAHRGVGALELLPAITGDADFCSHPLKVLKRSHQTRNQFEGRCSQTEAQR